MNYELNEEIYSNKSNKGKVTCNKNILLSIINLATKEIAGVSSLCDNFGSGIKRLFSNNYANGVKIEYGKNGIVIDVYVIVYEGYSVPDIAYKVQENIKNGISSMLDVNIDKINVHVQGVDFSKKVD
ncbi:MAG: Asp23/Gls24 family envelope stress response protein [Clostridia bacterium]|nr:Asp23/Gls24 family envelope stress response protein [Clostridia bacterium]